jgi:hypothetical protein
MGRKRIRYDEGQWFAVPLRRGGYALGIIVRGNYRTKGGLGYFFGPRYDELPSDQATWDKNPEEAILITRFGDLGIIRGDWPLLQSTRPFLRIEWPIPKFGKKVSLLPGKAFVREYDQSETGKWILVRETVVDEKDIIGLPEDSASGGGAVEIELTEILDG